MAEMERENEEWKKRGDQVILFLCIFRINSPSMYTI